MILRSLLGGVLFAFFLADAGAQTSALILVGKFQGYRQTSAPELRATGALFSISFQVASSTPAVTSATLRTPNGAVVSLRVESDGTLQYEREFDDFQALERVFPDGRYALALSPSTTTIGFSVATNRPIDPVRITNFDALQSWIDPSDPVIRWEPISSAPSLDVLELSLQRRDGTQVFEAVSPQLARQPGQIVSGIPYFEDIEALLLYLAYSVGTADDGRTQIAAGSGFGLFFNLRRVKPVPVILSHPESVVTAGGMQAELEITIGQSDVTLRLLKNGVVTNAAPTILGTFPPKAYFAVPINSPDDAGSYTIEVSNGHDSVESKPARIVVMPQLEITTLAGSADAVGAADGAGWDARFNGASGIVVLPNGDLIVADTQNHVLRRITPAGLTTTFAGGLGQSGSANGSLAAARFNAPTALAIDGAGNLFVADSRNYVIRKISPDGGVSTYAGLVGQQFPVDGRPGIARFNTFGGLAVDAAGNLYASDPEAWIIRKILPDGSVTTIAGANRFENRSSVAQVVDGDRLTARFEEPRGMVFDAAGNLYVGDSWATRRISPLGIVTTLSESVGKPISVDTNFGDGRGPIDRTGAAEFMTIDQSGALYLTNKFTAIRRLTPNALTVTLAGGDSGFADGVGRRAAFRGIGGIAVDANGTVYVTDGGRRIRRGVLTRGGAPMIAFEGHPQLQTVAQGSSAVFTASATGPGISYQWFKDGVGIGGATEATLWLRTTARSDSGTYSVLAGNGAGAVASSPMPLVVVANQDPGRLVNLSVRSRAGGDRDTLTVGFVVGGAATGGRNLLMRAVGPTLGDFGVADVLSDPRLALAQNGITIATNDNWGGGDVLANAFAATGAFALPRSSLDSALTYTAGPAGYTLQVTAAGPKTGTVLVEVYDQGSAPAVGTSRLINLSTRTMIGSGAGALTAGFVVGGSTSRNVVIRALGPSLALQGNVTETALRVYKEAEILAINDGWGKTHTLQQAFTAAGAFPIFQNDAAMALTLAPGAYTVEMSAEVEAGIAVLEIYELP